MLLESGFEELGDQHVEGSGKDKGVGSALPPHTPHNAWRWPHIPGGYGPKPARPSPPNTDESLLQSARRALRTTWRRATTCLSRESLM